MIDTPPLNELEERARAELVGLSQAMLSGELSYFEGAVRVCGLRQRIRVSQFDPDIRAFISIESETDHLPMQHVRHRWAEETLRESEADFAKVEEWAAPFALDACKNLIQRFGSSLG